MAVIDALLLRLSALVALVLVTSCSGGGHTAATLQRPPASSAPAVTKVLTVVLENEDQAVTEEKMPALAALASRYGRTTDLHAATHPSLPNYLVLATGSSHGVQDDGPPAVHPVPGLSVFDAALAHGHTARVYAESMPAPCSQHTAGRYAVKHNPWAYLADATACTTDDVPAGTLDAGALHDDVVAGRLPDVGLVVPDLCNDAHDCPPATADQWLDGWLRQVQQGPDWRSGHLAVVVTFDEGSRGGDNRVLTVVASPRLHGKTVTTPLTHVAWTRWMTDLVAAPPLGDAATSPSLGAVFGLDP